MKKYIKSTLIFLIFWFALFMHMDPNTLEATSWHYWFFAILFFIWAGGGIVRLLLELRRAVHELLRLLE
ncbi:MAG: hypothetical protein OXE50_04885 [Chloroflexi bacterium]|nr:hypothetical protein [Chloroflexota bacterium]